LTHEPAPPVVADAPDPVSALAAAAQGDKAEVELQLRLLEEAVRSQRDQLWRNAALAAAARELIRASRRTKPKDSQQQLAVAFRSAYEACLRVVQAAPDEGIAWYQLGLSCVDRRDTTCAVGAFAIAALLETHEIPNSVADWLIEPERFPKRNARLRILTARGALFSTMLGGPAPTLELQRLAESELPE
jgi:hypothetical protein